MSSVFDLWAETLGRTREKLIGVITDVIDCAVDVTDRNDMMTDESLAFFDSGAKVRTLNFGVPNHEDIVADNTFVVKMFNLEDEDGAPLPDAYVRVTLEVLDRPVERGD